MSLILKKIIYLLKIRRLKTLFIDFYICFHVEISTRVECTVDMAIDNRTKCLKHL